MKSPADRFRSRQIALLLALWLTTPADASAQQPDAASPASVLSNEDVLKPDSVPQLGVPRGKSFEFKFEHSKFFPGTARKITVYVPAEYAGDMPACVYVGVDGLSDFAEPTVFDNLIYKHDMPVTIAIGLAPGIVESADLPHDPRFNRSVEFDGLNDNLARFLLDEVFPEVERHRTPDGLAIRLSKDPNDHAAGGASTGGIGAFTLAWERPDAVRRVFTAIGTFVGMRGGDRYPVLVRKTEPKPIRVFMQDGSNDEYMGSPEAGDWWMSNQTLERALKFSGYEVEHAWGNGAHDGKHAAAIFPDAMRWLWKDWPKPVATGESGNTYLKAVLRPGEPWQLAGVDDPYARGITADARIQTALGPHGHLYMTDSTSGNVWLTDRSGGRKTLLDSGLKAPTAIALSPDGLWLAVAERQSHFGFSYRVEPDGTVKDKQRYYWFHAPDDSDDSGVRAWVPDREGHLYAATRLGIQIFDLNGRVRAILPIPGGAATGLRFGGADLDTLYVLSADGGVYRRKLKIPGFAAGSAAVNVAGEDQW